MIRFGFVAVLTFVAVAFSTSAQASDTISLAGQWSFKLDPDGIGTKERWFAEKLPDTARLPGSLDEQGLGIKTTDRHLGRLTREYAYEGAAWYQKTVVVPPDWTDKHVQLFLERCHWETRVWVGDNYAGSQNSLCAPQVYDLSDWLTPGEHVLTVCVDNTVKINIGHSRGNMLWTHAITEETQTNWNGIIGRMELTATDPVWVDSIQAFPDVDKQTTHLRVVVAGMTRSPVEGTLSASAEPDGGSVSDVAFSTEDARAVVKMDVPFGAAPRLWDEFSPEMYDLRVTLSARAGGNEYTDGSSVRFGLRKFRADGSHFRLNDRRIHLRGNVDCAIFPLTGYPPMNIDEWKRLLDILKEYGMNHVRFHSWCPPEAAFAAADELGMFLQVEPPLWDGHGLVGSDIKRAAFILAEADRIIDTYGNHPSFCLMSMGNELGRGDDPYLHYLVDYLRKKDARRLYTTTTHPPNLERDDDFFVGAGTDKGIARGIRPFGDFRGSLAHYDRPLITHEVGQPAMYPNFEEIHKYTGHLKPRNFEAFRETLEQNKMLHLAEDFRLASGALAVEIYKENIEAQLRTPNAAGFQLLGLQDFSGQGTALIGLLDAFYDSKGLITAEQFRRFCEPTVPLLRMRGFTWKANETFTATAEISHYGAADLTKQRPAWSIKNEKGKVLGSGSFGPLDIPTGALTKLGKIEMKLDGAAAPCKLTVEVAIPETKIANAWHIWVYPGEADISHDADILVADTWDEDTRSALDAGGKVLLIPTRGTLQHVLPARWHSVFWARQLFAGQPPTMGILCDPAHPALAAFPTAFHADWQWHDLLERSEAMPLDEAPAEFFPIVQFVPDFNLNKKLGAVFETRAGNGRLMVSTIDLQSEIESRPAARQLLHSLLAYMRSDSFQPAHTIAPDILDKLLRRTAILENQGAPTDGAKAVLNVRASTKEAFAKAGAWRAAVDEQIALADGFGYTVQGGTYRDGRSSSWHAPHLIINVTCPRGFEGTFYAHFHDWNGQDRSAALFFGGRDLGPLPRYAGKGFWLKLPVTAAMSSEGRLTLDARATKGPNVMITQIVLVPKQ